MLIKAKEHAMTERSYEDAVQVLQQRLGFQWDGIEADGRDEMARILKRELGYDTNTAQNAITAMIESGQLRYQRASAADTNDALHDTAKPIAMAPNAPAASGLPGAGFVAGAGHWEIGPANDTGWESRPGQVTPH